MTRIITVTEVRNALNKAVSERGDHFVYQNHFTALGLGVDVCQYVFGGEPACIVGKALLDYLGMPWPERADGRPLNGSFLSVQAALEREWDVEFTPGAAMMLAVAQSVQDNSGTWGTAVRAAKTAAHAYEVLQPFVPPTA